MVRLPRSPNRTWALQYKVISLLTFPGYATFFPEASDYDLNGAPRSWAKIPAMRHALTLWPYGTYFWHLDQSALIMNPDLTIDSIMAPKRMEKLMIKDQPIVPPDSVIKTFTHLHGDQIDFTLTQDGSGLVPGSFILRRGDWAIFFLDTWFDPLYRSYNFQKADTHALVRFFCVSEERAQLISYRSILYSGIQLYSRS
jgi:mannan polymerase II complex MNN11 subunit